MAANLRQPELFEAGVTAPESTGEGMEIPSTIYDYLARDQEDLPAWLRDHRKGQPFNRQAFFAGRTVYYPGSGTDGHPVKLFGSSQSAHTFIYTDYILDREFIERRLADGLNRFLGYHNYDRIELTMQDLAPSGWIAHVPDSVIDRHGFIPKGFTPYGFIEILERDSDRDSSHGADRLAVLFLGADAYAAFDALYCQGDGTPAPYAIIIQDHGFGGNYDRFDARGLLAQMARKCRIHPKFLVVASNSTCWRRFQKVPGLPGDCGGMNNNSERFLYERSLYVPS